jgi:hypothetical protein
MVDTEARTKPRQTVADYLYERIMAFEFDERLQAIADNTKDQTVQDVIQALWFTYDDVKDHKVVLGKETWDLIQRLMLVLASGAELKLSDESRRVWHVSQALAVAALAAVGLTWYFLWHYWFFPCILGAASSIALHWWRERVACRLDLPDPSHAWPFQSPSVIRRVLRTTPGFRKLRFRPEVAQRRLRSRVLECVHWLPALALWCVFSPLVLLLQCLPLRVSRTNVVWPEGAPSTASPR